MLAQQTINTMNIRVLSHITKPFLSATFADWRTSTDRGMLSRARLVLVAVFAVACAVNVRAQVSIEAAIDSVQILIGEQAHMTVDVTANEGARISWPQLQPRQYLVPGVEIIEITDADTSHLDNNKVKVSRTLTITAFDEKLYSIPGMELKVDGKAFKGNTCALKVLTLDVDTVHPNQFFPPKDVQDNPFLWSEWSPLFWFSLLALLLTVALFYLTVRLKQNKPIITHIRIVKKVPAHQKALNAIDRIKAEKMQTSEDQKTYYTQLTDTLRQYIQERFGFSAMEMTSGEIIERLRENGDKTMIDELRELFSTADLVKFAKYSTLINENDLNLVNAINFIDQTKVEGQPTEERIVPKLSENDQRTIKVRLTIKGFIYGIVTVLLLLLAYVIYNMYQLLN